MTTEDDFQRALDADPSDWQTRLVFSDWLQERDDVRAEGYRMLGRLKKNSRKLEDGSWVWVYPPSQTSHKENVLPADWLECFSGIVDAELSSEDGWTRRDSEDAAAFAFANLTAERRDELLQSVPV